MATENKPPPRNPSTKWFSYLYYQHGRDSPAITRISLLVLSTIVLALTFHNGLNPPGGVWQRDVVAEPGKKLYSAGTPIFGARISSYWRMQYVMFLFYNTLAFWGSFSISSGLTVGSPYYIELLVTLTAIAVTYVSSVRAIRLPGTISGLSLGVAMILPYFLRILQQTIGARCTEKSPKAEEVFPRFVPSETARCTEARTSHSDLITGGIKFNTVNP